MFVCVSNWFDQAIYLSQAGLPVRGESIGEDALEGKDNYLESLKGIDAVFFVTKFGQIFWFVSDPLKASGFGGSIEQTALASSNGQKCMNVQDEIARVNS